MLSLSEVFLGESEKKAVKRVLQSGWLSQGKEVAAFEASFSKFLGGGVHAVAVSSCTAALHLALRLSGVGRGDEVIVPSLTFIATVHAARYLGAKPVFADILGDEDLTLDPEDVARKISKKTKAIICMHYGGYPCQMDRLTEIARENHLTLIEDAAHAPGGRFGKTSLGTIGDFGCFSFFPNKNMTTGEGGMLVTREEGWAKKARLLRSHAMTASSLDKKRGHAFSYDVVDLGYNYRMDELRAALGRIQLKRLASFNRKRRMLTRAYVEALQGLDVRIPFRGREEESACHLFVILLPEGVSRKQVMEKMKARKIQTSIHYPPAHFFSYCERRVQLPKTERVASRLLTLPLHSGMKRKDVEFVAEALKKILRA